MKRFIAAVAAAAFIGSIGRAATDDVGATMLERARQFLAGLDPALQSQASFAFDDAERLNWHFIPRPREGLAYTELGPARRRLADRLLGSAMSGEGMSKVFGIMYLDQILFEREGRDIRNPDGYYFSIFGEPADRGTWGWRLEGHHLALNFTLDDGELVATSPSFMGSNPAIVEEGPHAGFEVLAEEQSVARELLALFEDEAREAVVISDRAPRDIVTGNSLRAEPLEPAGLAVADMNEAQAEAVMALLRVYIERLHPTIAAEELTGITDAGVGEIHFAWAGSDEPGDPHYYRLQGPTFLVEYDNVQNNANHVHAVWRDFDGDFGRDILAEHYAAAHVR